MPKFISDTSSGAKILCSLVPSMMFPQGHHRLIKSKDFSAPGLVLNSSSANFLLGNLGLII